MNYSTPLTGKLTLGIACATLLSTVALPATAEPHDAKWGQSLHQANCAGCHSRPHNAAFYKARVGGKIKSLASLHNKVQACANHFNLSWFDEETNAVTSYLNQTYYHFK